MSNALTFAQQTLLKEYPAEEWTSDCVFTSPSWSATRDQVKTPGRLSNIASWLGRLKSCTRRWAIGRASKVFDFVFNKRLKQCRLSSYSKHILHNCTFDKQLQECEVKAARQTKIGANYNAIQWPPSSACSQAYLECKNGLSTSQQRRHFDQNTLNENICNFCSTTLWLGLLRLRSGWGCGANKLKGK